MGVALYDIPMLPLLHLALMCPSALHTCQSLKSPIANVPVRVCKQLAPPPPPHPVMQARAECPEED